MNEKNSPTLEDTFADFFGYDPDECHICGSTKNLIDTKDSPDGIETRKVCTTCRERLANGRKADAEKQNQDIADYEYYNEIFGD